MSLLGWINPKSINAIIRLPEETKNQTEIWDKKSDKMRVKRSVFISNNFFVDCFYILIKNIIIKIIISN